MLRTTTLLSMGFFSLLLFGTAELARADAGTKVKVFTVDAGVTDAKTSSIMEKPRAKPSEKPPETVNEAMGVGKRIVEAAKQGHWALMLGLIVMILTSLVNKVFRSKIPPAILPWVAIGLGVIGQGALALHHSGDWLSAIFAGMTAGLAAGGSYSAFGKYLPAVGKKKPKPEAA